MVNVSVFYEEYRAIVPGLENARDVLATLSLKRRQGWRVQLAGELGLSSSAPDHSFTIGAGKPVLTISWSTTTRRSCTRRSGAIATPSACSISRHAQSILSLTTRMLGAADAEDVAQDTFVAAYKALPTFKLDSKFTTWLYRIGVNKCTDALRARRPPARRSTPSRMTAP